MRLYRLCFLKSLLGKSFCILRPGRWGPAFGTGAGKDPLPQTPGGGCQVRAGSPEPEKQGQASDSVNSGAGKGLLQEFDIPVVQAVIH